MIFLFDGEKSIFALTKSFEILLKLLPIMIDYFGVTFTLVLFTYILLGEILQGILMEALSKKHTRIFNAKNI